MELLSTCNTMKPVGQSSQLLTKKHWQTAITKYHKWGDLETTEMYFSQFWRPQVQDQGLACSSEGPFPVADGHQNSHCVPRKGEVSKQLLASSCKGTDSITSVPALDHLSIAAAMGRLSLPLLHPFAHFFMPGLGLSMETSSVYTVVYRLRSKATYKFVHNWVLWPLHEARKKLPAAFCH